MSRQATQPVQSTANSQAAAGPDGGVARSSYLDQSLDRAHKLAVSQHHGAVTSEHLLFALTEDPEALGVLGASTVSIERLRADIGTHLSQLPGDTPANKPILPNPDLLKVLKLAAMAAQQSSRRQIDGAIVLAAMIGDASTPSAGLLKAHGLTFNEVIRVLQKAVAPAPAAPSPRAMPPPTAMPAAVPPPVAPLPMTAPPMPVTARQAPPQMDPPTQPVRPSPAPVAESQADRVATASAAAEAVAKDLAGQAPSAPSSTDDLLASVRARLQQSAPPPKPRAVEPQAPSPMRSPEPEPTPEIVASAAEREAKKPQPIEDRGADQKETPAPPAETAAVAPNPAKPAAPSIEDVAEALPLPKREPPKTPLRADVPLTPDDLVQQPVTERISPLKAPPGPPRMPATQTAAPALSSVAGPQSAIPPLPLVPAAPRGAPPPLPMPPQSGPKTAPPPLSTAPAAAAPMTRIPPIPPPTVDMRALMAVVPRQMRQGDTSVVEIVVPRRALEIPMTQGHRWPPLRVTTMRLRAAPDAAHVELTSPETLWISPPRVHQGAGDDAMWRWRVTPREPGLFKLNLSGATRIVGGEGISGEVPLGEETIEIDVAKRGSRRWLVGVLLFGNLIALGLLAMIMSGRATGMVLGAWGAVRSMVGG